MYYCTFLNTSSLYLINDKWIIMEKIVYNNIYKARLNKKFTQEYIADRLSISQTYYSKIERGLKKITLDKIIHIAHILEINPKDLFDPM